MDFIFWIAVLAVVTVVIASFQYWMIWLMMSLARLRRIRSRVLGEEEIPSLLRQAAAPIERQLLDLGFVYRGGMASFNVVYDVPGECLALIFFHPEHQAIATITEVPYPGSLRPFEVNFYNLLPQGRVLHTSDCFAHQTFEVPQEFIQQDMYSADLQQQWRLHTQRLNLNPAAEDDWSPVVLETNNLEFLAQWLQQSYERFFDYWLASRKVLRLADDVYFLNPLYTARFTGNWIRSHKRALAAMQKASAEDAVGGRYLLERQLAFRRTSNAVSKIMLLIVSLVGFYLAFGLLLSWSLVPLLILVLLLHEYGHYWAMRYFGYQDTQIFFVPFLGAAATGNKAEPKLWQEIIVYLAGPVPGILVGLALLWSPWVEIWNWLREFAYLCLVLNIINLLPLTPLDGGRIVEKLVFVRYASARLWFCGFSAACFAAGAWYARDPVLLLLTALTGFMAWGEWQKRPLLQKIRHRLSDTHHEQVDERKKRVIDALFEEPLAPRFRLNLAREMLAFVKDRPANIRTILLGMLVYSLVLGGSVTAAVHRVNSANFSGDEDYYSAEYWRAAVNEEKEIDGMSWRTTLAAIESIRSGPQPEDAQEFIVTAEAQVAQWQQPDLRLAQWRLLKPVLTEVPLVEQDVHYVRDNVLRDQSAETYERIHTLYRLVDARSLMDDNDRLGLLEDALLLQQKNPVEYTNIVADVHFRKGELLQQAGDQAAARQSFEQGFQLELGSQLPLYQDSNYEALLDLYFVDGDFQAALSMIESRLAALGRYIAQYPDEFEDYERRVTEKVRQQHGWFLLLTENAAASDTFVALMESHKPDPDKSGYDKKVLEFLLDALNSHQHQGLENAALVAALRDLPPAHTSRFIQGCNCGNRGPFDTYRHERYLALLREQGFSESP